MKIILFDKNEVARQWLSDNDLIEATYIEEINAAGQLTFSLPLQEPLNENYFYAAIPHPHGGAGYVWLKLVKQQALADRLQYTAIEAAYDELRAYDYVKDIRPKNRTAGAMLGQVLQGTRWVPGVTYGDTEGSTNFYYISTLEAIQKIADLFKLEVAFDVLINAKTNRIDRRQVHLYAQQGQRTGKRFEYGSNLLTVTREESHEDLITALIGRGKGEQVSEGDEQTPDGYGRRIDFADVVWSTKNGNPVNKPAGQIYVEDKAATATFGFSDGRPRIGLQIFEDIEDKGELLKATWAALQTLKRPKVSFKADVIDVGNLDLGDTVAIIRHDIGIEYFTRVFKVTHNLLNERLNTIELGDNFAASNSITRTVDYIKGMVHENNERTVNAIVSANGKNTNYYGPNQPSHPAEGDLWYKDLGNGDVDLYQYQDGAWVLLTSTRDLKVVEKKLQDVKAEFDQKWQAAQVSDEQIQADIEKNRREIETKISNANNDVIDRVTGIISADEIRVAQDIANNRAQLEQSLTDAQKDFNAKVEALKQGDSQVLKQANDFASGKFNLAMQSANGKSTNYYSSTAPSNPKQGDTWFRVNSDGTVTVLAWTGSKWQDEEVIRKINMEGRGKINGDKLHITGTTSIDAAVITDAMIKGVSANKLTAGTIDAGKISVTNINATNINTGIINADLITAGHLKADRISGGSLDFASVNALNLKADKITSGTLDASKVKITHLDASNIDTGALNASLIKVGFMSADRISGGELDFKYVNALNLKADKITSGTLDASRVNITHLDASNIDTGTLDANLITTGFMSANRIFGGELDFRYVNAANLTADKITSGTLNAGNVNIINLNVDNLSGNKTNFIKSYWNGISSYIDINGSRLRAGSAGNGYIELTWNGMHVYDSYNNEEMGWIHGNHYEGHPEQNGLVFDLEAPNGDYMAWAMRENNSDKNYTIQMELRRGNWGNKQQGLNFFADAKFHGNIYPADKSVGYGPLKLIRMTVNGHGWGTALVGANSHENGIWIGDNGEAGITTGTGENVHIF